MPRKIQRLLIANRGEIATRIIQSARDLGIDTVTIYTENDDSHTLYSSQALRLSSAAAYLNIDELVAVAKSARCDAVHPGYGFLSESAEFAQRMWEEADALVVGPGAEILERTADKLQARLLAEECGVPVLPALRKPTREVKDIERFAKDVGLPIMIKAVDGGGGRGIRTVRKAEELPGAVKRAVEESPSRLVFAEKAAVDGFRHVEVQIVGDGKGKVKHLWERECSIQRRYQKVVEIAPSRIENRDLVRRIIEAAVSMAEKINYLSLGTFEMLANSETSEFYFLEINPRLQVEHTITECISLVDLVKTQLKIAQGEAFESTDLRRVAGRAEIPPYDLHSIQLRITAEDVRNQWTLSVGKIQNFNFPSGNGVRVDTHLINGHPTIVSTDYDSLIAKIIVTASSWDEVVAKAGRALKDTHIGGIKTNIDILRGIVASQAFKDGDCDTQWLESQLSSVLKTGEQITQAQSPTPFGAFVKSSTSGTSTSSMPSFSTSSVILRKGDAWSVNIRPATDSQVHNPETSSTDTATHHLKLLKILRNEFPSSLAAEISYATAASPNPTPIRIELAATSATSSAVMSSETLRRGDPKNSKHIIIPFPGKLCEVLVDEGDVIRVGDVVCVVQQMKMELEVRASRGGRVKWVIEAEEGEDVADGSLAVELEDIDETRSKL